MRDDRRFVVEKRPSISEVNAARSPSRLVIDRRAVRDQARFVVANCVNSKSTSTRAFRGRVLFTALCAAPHACVISPTLRRCALRS
jgi:hypothetical protein